MIQFRNSSPRSRYARQLRDVTRGPDDRREIGTGNGMGVTCSLGELLTRMANWQSHFFRFELVAS